MTTTDRPVTCTACGEIEPEDNEGWMDAPSGNSYCPVCFDALFVRRGAPAVVDALLRAAGGERGKH